MATPSLHEYTSALLSLLDYHLSLVDDCCVDMDKDEYETIVRLLQMGYVVGGKI